MTFMLTEINHITLLVRDKAGSEKFYSTVLGLTPVRVGSSLWMKIGSNQFIHLSGSADPLPETLQHVGIFVHNWSELLDHLEQQNIELQIFDEAGSLIPAGYDEARQSQNVFLRDPSGNMLELIDENNTFYENKKDQNA